MDASTCNSADNSLTLLNLGCGHICPDGWINVDGSNRAWLASKWPLIDHLMTSLKLIPVTEFSRATVYANLLRRFPWKTDSVDGIYMGEILEHFTLEQGKFVLAECYRVLKPHGVLRVRVPDYAAFSRRYLEAYDAIRSRPREQWNSEHARFVEMFFGDICVQHLRRFSSLGHFHKWMYDDVSLILLFEEIGFREVDRRKLHDSRLEGIQKVESREFLICEGVKFGQTRFR